MLLYIYVYNFYICNFYICMYNLHNIYIFYVYINVSHGHLRAPDLYAVHGSV